MGFVLVGMLIAAPTQLPEADDVVVQADGAILHGHVISCGDGIRFVPAGYAEIRFSPESLLSVTRASGEPCVVRRPRNVGGAVATLLVFPLLGSALGGIIGSQACRGSGDTTPCALAGVAAGAATGVLVGGTILVVTAMSTDEISLPRAYARRATKQSVSFSVALRF
jgi:hypothetical protein